MTDTARTLTLVVPSGLVLLVAVSEMIQGLGVLLG
jgi:hypothetical protein